MKLYIYDTDTMSLLAIIDADDNDTCETLASAHYGDTDLYGWTYTDVGLYEDQPIAYL